MKRLFFTLALAFIAIPAWGQNPAWSLHDTEVLCGSGAPDIRIKMCTSLIQSGRESGLALLQVYYDRGTAYLQQGLYDQSIADLTKAIELNPNVIYTYIYRGTAYAKKDLYDQAIAD
jgi:tetratricopeptide (TPR) repeat protein